MTIHFGDSTSIATAPPFVSYAIIADKKTSGTNGGSLTSGDWRRRDLNTEVTDPDGIVSVSGNEFTLGARTYFIDLSVPCRQGTSYTCKLYNETDGGDIALGTSENAHISYIGTTRSFLSTRVTLSGTKRLSVYIKSSHSVSGTGMGSGHNSGTNTYTVVKIFKEN